MPCLGNAFRITGTLWGKSTGYQWIPLTKSPVMQSVDDFCIVNLNYMLNKQLNCLTLMWHHCNLWTKRIPTAVDQYDGCRGPDTKWAPGHTHITQWISRVTRIKWNLIDIIWQVATRHLHYQSRLVSSSTRKAHKKSIMTFSGTSLNSYQPHLSKKSPLIFKKNKWVKVQFRGMQLYKEIDGYRYEEFYLPRIFRLPL